MRAVVEKIVIIEIGEAVYFRFLVLEVNESWDGSGVYLKSIDISL